MGTPSRWRSSQLQIALGVLALHVAIIALLLMHVGPPGGTDTAPTDAIQVVFFPPTQAPQAAANSVHLKRLKVDMGIALSLPTLDASSLPPPSSGSHGDGPGVNWTAEARRAVRAFEIRRDQHVTHAEFGESPWDGWLPQQEHRAGDKLRTANGDWIVWVDGNCYQVAKWYSGAPPEATSPPRTFCLPKDNQ